MPPSKDAGRDGVDVYRIIVHASPPSDSGFPHWTEAPECPAAHEGGRTAEEAVSQTMQSIKAWRADHGAQTDEEIEFHIEEAR